MIIASALAREPAREQREHRMLRWMRRGFFMLCCQNGGTNLTTGGIL